MKLILLLILPPVLLVLIVFLYSWYRLHIKLDFHANNSDRLLPVGWKVETEFVKTSDNNKITYWYFPVSNPKAFVILVHGHSNPGGKSQMVRHAEYLYEAGYSTVLVDLRSYGESDGDKMTLGVNEWKDLEAVYDYVKSLPETKDRKVGFFGISMGAFTSLVALGQTAKGDFVIASVPYSNFDSLFRFQIKAVGLPSSVFYPFMRIAGFLELGWDYEKFTADKAIGNIKSPVFLISAKHDEQVNSQDARDLYDLANQPKEYWEADSGHDVYGKYPEEFEKKILDFLEKYSL